MQVNNSQANSQLIDLEIRLFGLPLEELWNRTAYDTRIHRIRRVFETRYAEPALSVSDISHDCGMTVSNLNRIMGSLTGRTGYQLLICFRILRSIIEALEYNSRFAEIAVHNGFDNSASYSRTVRRVLGCPPSKLIRRGDGFRRELYLPAIAEKEHAAKHAAKAVERLQKADLF